MSTENKDAVTKEAPVLKISSIQQDLKDGLTRADIAEKYGITKSELSRHFQHPKLKGLKTITKPVNAFRLLDDTEDEAETANEKDPAATNATDTPVAATTDTTAAVSATDAKASLTSQKFQKPSVANGFSTTTPV